MRVGANSASLMLIVSNNNTSAYQARELFQMDLKDLIPQDGPQRAYCDKCGAGTDLVFRLYHQVVSDIEISIDKLPQLYCVSCDLHFLPDRSVAAILYSHEQASNKGWSRFVSNRKKITENFAFTTVPFEYDPDDYYYYPGLEREHDVGFLTPVFFNLRVLAKYDASPDYTVHYSSTTYGEIDTGNFSISFGVNRNGSLLMWLGDIAQLPINEQYYLKSENQPSDHCIASEFYDGQIEVIFTPPSLETKLFAARSAFHAACFIRFATKLGHLETEVLKIAERTLRPILDIETSRRNLADSLNKIHIESLDNDALGSLTVKLRIKPASSGSLKRLQAILETIDTTEIINSLLSPFYTLYDLRIAYSHIGSDAGTIQRLKKITDRLDLPESATLIQIYDQLIVGLTNSYIALEAIVKPQV